MDEIEVPDGVDEAEVEALWEEAKTAADGAWFPGNIPQNPYKPDDWRHGVFGSALAHYLMQNGWH